MKTIIHNNDNLTLKNINKTVKRAKAIIVNENGEILLAITNRAIFLPGGHVEGKETYDECLTREIEEETGVHIDNIQKKEILNIEYYSKDYPEKGVNTHYISKYFVVNASIKPDYSKIKLTKEEKESNFKVTYIPKEKVLDLLYETLDKYKGFGSVRDTIEAVKEYLKQE